jgi:hypothetical protein
MFKHWFLGAELGRDEYLRLVELSREAGRGLL